MYVLLLLRILLYVLVCSYACTLLKLITMMPSGGSEGLFAQKTLEITDDILATYKNQGINFAFKI